MMYGVGGTTMLNEPQILFLFLSILVDGVILKLFFEMKWTEVVVASLLVNFVTGLLFLTVIPFLLLFLRYMPILYLSLALVLILFLILLLKVFLVHIIFKISITKIRFLSFVIANILTFVFIICVILPIYVY